MILDLANRAFATTRWSLLFTLCVPCAATAASDTEAFVASIGSVELVKQRIRQHLSERCGTGACFDANATAICENVGALDVRFGSQISRPTSKPAVKPEIDISATDLRLMSKIWSHCKPTHYQHWNDGQVLHVIYDPDPKEDAVIRRLLGAPDD